MNLTQRDKERLRAALPGLKNAERVSGVPWEVLAAILYRENKLAVSPPKTPGGPFQLDPIPAPDALRGLLKRFTTLTPDEMEQCIQKGVNDFKSAAIFGACILRRNCKPRITRQSSDADIKDAFYGYNGRAYGSADRSPYVMNNADAAHMDMRVVGTIPDGKGGRKKINTVDMNPGAFPVYKAIKELGW